MELYYGIIFMKRIPWDPRDPLGTPLGPRGTPLGPLGTPLGWLGTPLGPPGTPLGPLGTPYGRLMEHKNGYISTNRQRQKLSIAVFEAAHEGPSHERLDRAVFPLKSPPKSKKVPPIPGYRPG